jgi:hypothetical protein
VQKETISCVSRDVLSLFHEISTTVQKFHPALGELEYATLEEVCPSMSQPCTHGVRDCLLMLTVKVPHVIL